LQVKGSSAVIKYRDRDGVIQAIVVDANELDSHRVGQESNITYKAVKDGTPFGIDWSIVYPNGIVIPSSDIQEVMYAQGIYTLEDLVINSVKLVQAVNSLARWTGAKIIHQVKEVLGGSE
jgi:hypothetical protein